MRKLLPAVLVLVVVLAGFPLFALLAIVSMSSHAAATCLPTTAAAKAAGDGTLTGSVTMATANIPARSGLSGFRASMPKVLSTQPDFVALQEVGHRTLAQIEAAAPGYTAYRDPTPDTGPGSSQAMNNAVLWTTATWTKADAGRVKIADDDQAYHRGRPVTWDRYATWATLQRGSDGAVVSVVSVHHMTNPRKYPRQHGNPPQTRAEQYGHGMDTLLVLVDQLDDHGPVLIGGDLNTPASRQNHSWSAAAKMTAAGYAWATHGVDFVFFPRTLGVRLDKSWTGPMTSDHQWVAARLDMDGAAPGSTASGGGVLGRLMRLRLTPFSPTLTREQASNAVTVAQITRELGLPRRALEVALATALQESRLLNLDHGDRDSLGLFQQRPSQGWGTPAQTTDPVLATRAFYGRADHTNNTGLLDIDGWPTLPLSQAAQAVQRSAYPGAYARWEPAASDITDILGANLPTVPDTAGVAGVSQDCAAGAAPVTLASFNILGASHTDGKPGSGLGGRENHSMPGWEVRLPEAMALLESTGVTIAGLQEVHPPQSKALATTYADRWGMYPRDRLQNKVIWDRTAWRMTDSRLVDIPYHYGHETPMPLVQLTSTTTGQVIWVWSIHNPIGARKHRAEALRRQHDTLTDLAATGTPVVIVGDFNDGHDGPRRSHCTLTPTLANAFGGQADPCRPPKGGAPIDHIYGANLTWANGRVDRTPRRDKISDHPLVVATTAAADGGSCPPTGSPAEKGLTPDALLVLRSVEARFGTHTYIGVGDRRNNSSSDHPSGRAVDVMIDGWDTPAGIEHGTRIAAWIRDHARELGVTYLIWRKQIWSTGDTDWRPYTHPSGQSSPTLDHMDHVHVSVAGTRGTRDCGSGTGQAGEVVYPVPAAYIDADLHNWHAAGAHWTTWHTGTDFSTPCGVAVYAAHAGTVEIDTSQGWAGPWLVKVTTGPDTVATWYAHMQTLDVARGQKVSAGQRIGSVGAQGNATGCHLHFEVHLSNGPIYDPDNTNPSTWLAQHANRGTGPQEETGHAA